jgi:hypothetical protein
MLSRRGGDKEAVICVGCFEALSIVRTAVVMLCVIKGALLSFAWYLRINNQRRRSLSHAAYAASPLTSPLTIETP